MNNFEKFLSLCVCIIYAQSQLVSSQHPIPSISEQIQRLQQNQQPQKETEQKDLIKKQNPESVPMSQYNYRTPVSGGYNTYQGYPREMYTGVASQSISPISPSKGNLFNLASGGDYFLTVTISQVFYGFVGVVVFIAMIVWGAKYLWASDHFSGIVQKIKDGSSGTGKSMDLNRLTNMVYKAIDSYENSDAKEVQL